MNRKQSAVIQIIAFSITAIVLVGILIAGMSGHLFNGNFSLFSYSGDSYRNADKYIAGSGEVNADGIRNIEINWLDGAIDVEVYDGDTIQFSETARKNLDKEDQLQYYQQGDRLIIQYRKMNHTPFFNFSNSFHKNLTVKVPMTLAEELDDFSIDTVSSESKMIGINAKKISYDSTSGDLLLQNSTSDRLDFNSTSGSLTGEGLTVTGKAEADTISGSAKLEGSLENIQFDSVSGELEITTKLCPQNINSDTVSGDVTLFLPENEGFTCSKDTVSGSYSSEFEVRWEDDKGIYKNGDRDFSFESVSGNVNINKNTAE